MHVEQIDRFGMLASSLCAVHCAALALLPAALGVLGLEFLLSHQAEWGFTLIAIAFATGALTLGWRRHRSTQVAAWLVLGIIGLLVSRGLESGSMHHPHHGDRHHTEAENAATPESALAPEYGAVPPPTEDHAEHAAGPHVATSSPDNNAHLADGHLAGTAVGVLAGMLLLVGHVLNSRTLRHRPADCA